MRVIGSHATLVSCSLMLSQHYHVFYLLTLSGNAPRCALLYIILLCLMPHDFTCQGESAAIQWVNKLRHSKTYFVKLEFEMSPVIIHNSQLSSSLI
jgi:hypothetical protein